MTHKYVSSKLRHKGFRQWRVAFSASVLDPQRQNWVRCNSFLSRKCIWKCRLQNVDHFVEAPSICALSEAACATSAPYGNQLTYIVYRKPVSAKIRHLQINIHTRPDDVKTWERFPYYWTFVRGIHQLGFKDSRIQRYLFDKENTCFLIIHPRYLIFWDQNQFLATCGSARR